MRTRGVTFVWYVAVLLAVSGIVQAADSPPVKIAFDEHSARRDLVSGRELTNYTQVERGSILFYLDRLDKPDKFFNFYHDGVNQAQISSLRLIEKLQPQYDLWRLRYKNGGKNTPRIHHKAVSFVPLSSSGQPERRVYVLMNDLRLIDWGNETK